MQAANRLQKALRSGSGLSFGAWQELPGTNHSRALARSGFDWILVDMEHGNIDDGVMHESVAAIAACGASPIVRVAGNESWMVKRALDAGAHGVVIPLLCTVQDVRKAVSFTKYPPRGVRGFGPTFASQSFGNIPMMEYLKQADEGILTVVQIETKEALADVDEIAKVPGLDVLFAGPFDLGINIGHPIKDGKMPDKLKEALAQILRAAENNGKRAGIYCTSGEQARNFADQGFHMISVCADIDVLQAGLASALVTAKGSIAHSAYNLAKGAVGKIGSSGKDKP
ncbi:HpcH/HpaI aldolase/citrate lyase family protein [Xylona heveae TC161]|uniref:HpcH/HpaI aldolase/citrate lyase family protein n=1 Tax=Xylona heveae (strain CBS 132557 / TC161) TaxID=1328760 RepID=A0A165GJB1_XYLHT|nr:HpcH/HpaI aldolase/citrate lyase family protein [Xylona heveae TC161]KZF22257.1 HpcH/HpaI aldolase/citrate lyase family protein [Xylona heveae TC161]